MAWVHECDHPLIWTTPRYGDPGGLEVRLTTHLARIACMMRKDRR